MAIFFREDCRTLRDSLQLEMVAAQYWLRIRDVVTTAGVPVAEAVGAGVVQELEREGDPLSHAILRAFAQLAVGDTATRSANAVARLAERGVDLPPHFGDVGEAAPTGAWRARGDQWGEYTFFAEFEYPLGGRHCIALYVPEAGGTIKHIGLIGPLGQVDDGAFSPSAMERLSSATAGALLSELLDRSYGPLARETDDYRVSIAVARARSLVVAGGGELPRPRR
ncbi:MAG: hypothetical protein ACJ760_08375 [Thermoleophilaceae bacterium]